MKKPFFTILTFFLLTNVFGQKIEYRISFNSGLFSYSGDFTTAATFVTYNRDSKTGWANNPYGSKNGLSYGLSASLKKVTSKNVIWGFDLGYETLRSKVNINNIGVITSPTTSDEEFDASGHVFLNSDFINLFPHFGFRLNSKYINYDITGGFDYAFCLKAIEKVTATASNGIKYKTSADRKTINTDIRPRIQISADYKKAGIYLGYSFGLTNYTSNYYYLPGGYCYSRLIRFGLSYKIN